MISRHWYQNETVEIDGKTFDHCRFTNVTFYYHGLADTTFLEAKLEGSIGFQTDNQSAMGALILYNFIMGKKGITFKGVFIKDAAGNLTPIFPPSAKQGLM